MNYNLTRQDVAQTLNISTRSVDRYIKSWKLRSQKKWKVVFVNESDVENLKSGVNKNHEVIVPKKKQNINDKDIEKRSSIKAQDSIKNDTLDMIYKDLRDEIKSKDEIIQQISIRLWRAEEIAKNSVSLVEFKKSQFLLEERKWYLNNEAQKFKKQKEDIEKNLKYEKTTNLVLIIFMIILLIFSAILWFIKI